ncbi:hypothetical protein BDV33DRAFT_185751 [Aspergillus novoparasiticus]|uniref:Uncharacterized protein n=1 Tax=Aspergillus novoparasiticus TaxID=986946 RepID=A0A5N6E5Y0_9EURO|nr:hypothetical protein BDV33DRAFT_185751 [Aspergillus novoparasiticus]
MVWYARSISRVRLWLNWTSSGSWRSWGRAARAATAGKEWPCRYFGHWVSSSQGEISVASRCSTICRSSAWSAARSQSRSRLAWAWINATRLMPSGFWRSLLACAEDWI